MTVARHYSIIVWSDSCSGQNKNFKMIGFWQYVILSKRFAKLNDIKQQLKFIPAASLTDAEQAEAIPIHRQSSILNKAHKRHVFFQFQSINVVNQGSFFHKYNSTNFCITGRKEFLSMMTTKLKVHFQCTA